MFDIIMSPVKSAVAAAREWVADQFHQAFRQGAAEGAKRFAAELDGFVAGLAAPVATGKPQAIPVMASATQVTTAPDDREAKFAHAKSLVDGGMSMREAAKTADVPYSTLQERLSKGGA